MATRKVVGCLPHSASEPNASFIIQLYLRLNYWLSVFKVFLVQIAQATYKKAWHTKQYMHKWRIEQGCRFPDDNKRLLLALFFTCEFNWPLNLTGKCRCCIILWLGIHRLSKGVERWPHRLLGNARWQCWNFGRIIFFQYEAYEKEGVHQ